MRLFDQPEQVFVGAHPDVVGHGSLLVGRLTITSLKLLAFVRVQLVVPVNRLFAQEAQVCLPSDHGVDMLDDKRAFFSLKVIFAPQEVVPQEEVNGETASKVLQLSLPFLAWLPVGLTLLIDLT